MGADTVASLCGACIERIERVPEPICQLCGLPLQAAIPPPFLETADGQRGNPALCRACVESPPHFRRARAVALYRPGITEDGQVVPSIIRRHKYGRDQALSRALAQCLGDMLPLNGNDYDVVIPVPLHRRRLRWRGFNQAALLSRAVADRINCSLDVAILARITNSPPQTSQDRSQRRQNVRGSFAVTRPDRLANRRVLLVDDVMTTGATLDECARTMLAAGAQVVDVFTLARAV
jgi:ComF family protein